MPSSLVPSVFRGSHPAATAARILVFCCACWAFSFPTMKALELIGRSQLPAHGSLFFAAACVALRFSAATLLLAPFIGRSLLGLTWREFQQGLGLGVFGGLGLLLQMDGLSYTQASTSAFLTQGYCLWLPVWIALRHRRWPAPVVLVACGMVLLGGAVLAGVDLRHLHLGRGEWETLAGSVFFAAQILWLERPVFRGNNVLRFTLVMFAIMALLTLPLAFLTADTPADLFQAFATPAAGVLMMILVVVCTLVTFLLANRWQPEVSATEAGLLYSTEPVFAAGLVLFIPGLISPWAGIEYPNERLTQNLLVGGGLILAANAALQIHTARTSPPPAPPAAEPDPSSTPVLLGTGAQRHESLRPESHLPGR